MTIIWYMVPEISSAIDIIFCDFGPFFCSFTPPNNSKYQNFEKVKKTRIDITILHLFTINDNHMIYGSWDIECNRQNFLSFWTVFCPFTPPPLSTQKIKILEKWKKTLKILSFYKCVPWMAVTWFMVPEIWSATDRIFKKSKCWKNEKTAWR